MSIALTTLNPQPNTEKQISVKPRFKKCTVCHLQFTLGSVVLLTQYCEGDKIEKNEMGWACGAYG